MMIACRRSTAGHASHHPGLRECLPLRLQLRHAHLQRHRYRADARGGAGRVVSPEPRQARQAPVGARAAAELHPQPHPADGVGRGHGLHHPDRGDHLHLRPVRQLSRLLSAHRSGGARCRGHQPHPGDGHRGDRDRAVVQHPRARFPRLSAAFHQAVRAAAAGADCVHAAQHHRGDPEAAEPRRSGCSATSSAGS